MFQTISESAGNFQFKKIILGHLRVSQSRYKYDREFSYLFPLGKAGQNRRLFYNSENESINRHFRSSVEINIHYKSCNVGLSLSGSNL
jgi:hypothetical protein